ncbi:hypothetical protein [Bradyrhizobium sp. C9]|uniref:hypothetical protein n=1 Tax=Bradyrhizobium sp. C9 TaxID=142585 RepID=UPI000BE844BC|nr:hypothetical protein [Bradyrhizobium sp. C9]PDT73059.1 hypothetical protein CO675_32165 [Bradyrhizobium sp. C9]
MLELIVADDEKTRVQESLQSIIASALPSQGVCNVGFPGGNDDLELFSKGHGELWFGTRILSNARIPRYWNAFGTFDPTRTSQTIVLEINVAIHENGQRVSGFFARDPLAGKTYLMHTGKVGGGTRGVGKREFLAWSRSPSLPVFDGKSRAKRLGIAVGVLDRMTLVESISQFVKQVASFKEFVRQGRHETPEFRKRVADL